MAIPEGQPVPTKRRREELKMTDLTLDQAYVWLLCLTGAVVALTIAVYVVASVHHRKKGK